MCQTFIYQSTQESLLKTRVHKQNDGYNRFGNYQNEEENTADLKTEECKLDADVTCHVYCCQGKVAGVLLRLN